MKGFNITYVNGLCISSVSLNLDAKAIVTTFEGYYRVTNYIPILCSHWFQIFDPPTIYYQSLL